MRNRIKEEIKVSLDTPLIFSLKAIVPGEKKLVLFWACCVGSVPYRSGNNPRLGHPPSSISRLSSSSLTSNPPPPSNLRFFLFLFPSAFLLSLQLFSFPGKKHSKKHLSTLQIVPISSAPLRKNVFWPRPKFIAFFDCLSSSLRIPELAFTSVIRTALACLVAIFSVLTPKSSIFDLRHRVNYFFFIRLGFAEHFPRTPYHFFVVLLRARLLLLKNILLIVFSFSFSFSFFSFRGVCQQITSTSASSRPLPRVRDFQNLASPCTAWFFYYLPSLLLATRSLCISSPLIEPPTLASTLSFSVVEFRSRRLIPTYCIDTIIP